MRRIWFLFLCSLLPIFTSIAVAQKPTPREGNWWHSISEPEKVSYLIGYVDGIGTGESLAASQGSSFKSDAPAGCTAAKAMDFSNVQIGQINEGLDSFYKDSSNISIDSNLALLFVRDQASGCGEVFLAQEILVLRQTLTSHN